jgi:cation:H+ antiporter
MLTTLLFFAGLILVWKGADFLIDGSAGLAHRLGVRTFIIGLTIVSFGTSAPELVVNIIAAYRGSSGLAFGNVLGSNVANLLLVLGIAAILGTIRTQTTTIRWELPATALLTLLIIAMIYIPLLGPGELGRIEALLLLLLFAGFLYYVYHISRAGPRPPARLSAMTKKRGILFILLGTAGLGLGAHWLVSSGIHIADRLGLSEGYVGFFFIAVGTSLPEIVATVQAARKKYLELAIGNIIGSNIFNLLFVLGVTGLILPLQAEPDTPYHLAAAAIAPLIVLAFLIPRNRIARPAGITFLILYTAWIVWLTHWIRA